VTSEFWNRSFEAVLNTITLMHIIKSPWRKEFRAIISTAKDTLRVAAPYYRAGPVRDVLKHSKGCKKLFLLTLSERAVRAGFQSTSALKAIKGDRRSQVRFLTNLHAKFIVADRKSAVVTSANLTDGGLEGNAEMGVYFDDTIGVKGLIEYFDALWLNASPISPKELAYYTMLPSDKSNGKVGRTHGHKVRLGNLSKRPPAAGTPMLGWIVFHAPKSYQNHRDKSPIGELARRWKRSTRELDWNWTGTPMKENFIPHTLLLAWDGKVFGKATATITRDIGNDMRRKSYTFAFVISHYEKAKRAVPIGSLGIRSHRSFIKLTQEKLAAYDQRQH
jgi:hypothetical protein